MAAAARPTPPAADTTVAERAGLVPRATALPPGPRATELFARGQQAERQGDISGARRLYSTAAQQGHAMAARNLGRLYDPVYLGQTALGGIDADPAIARQWYERALAMGDAEASPLVKALSAR
jgi:TPR repeat protein